MPIPNISTPMGKVTVRERIYNTLCGWIVDGTVQPGEKILDAEIAAYFEVSRTPVREAMQILADQRLVDIVPGRETRVSLINSDESRQVYSLLAVLHGEAVSLAFPRLDSVEIAKLKEINDKLYNSMDLRNPAVSLQYDCMFHNVILGLANNCFLSDCAEKMLVHVLRVEYLHYKNPNFKICSADEHSKIISALEGHNLEGAVAEMKSNWIHFSLDMDVV